MTPFITPWQFTRRFETADLQAETVLPLLHEQLAQQLQLDEQQETVHTVLAELYNNALEHGVLELDSALKDSAQGYEAYYAERAQRLKALKQGFITVELRCGGDSQSWLDILVEDSGKGFDTSVYTQNNPSVLAGRGMALLSQLCEQLEYSRGGRRAQVRVLIRVTTKRLSDSCE